MKSGPTRFSPHFISKCLFLCLFAFSLAFSGDAAAATKKKNKRPAVQVTRMDEKNPKYAAIVIDAESGTILHEENADATRYPASLTKLMTALIVFEEIDSGRMRMDDRISISQHAASQAPSKIGLRAGSTIRLQDALMSIVTKSANDMAVALAEAVSGSESAFAQRMTKKARDIGMSRTRFYNASGLPNTSQVSTARDMARLARYIIRNHPQQARAFSRQSFVYNGVTYANHNHLMETYEGMDCCKTGYINASGFNLVASAKRGNKRLIGVVFGGKSAVSRNIHMAGLLDEGFEDVSSTRYAHNKQTPAASQPILTANTAPVRDLPLQRQAQLRQAQPGQAQPGQAQPEQTAANIAVAQVNARQPAPVAVTRLQQTQPTYASQSMGTLRMASLNTAAGEPAPATAPLPPVSSALANSPGWSIQIGAYETRNATDLALYQAQKALPAHLHKTQSQVVPLRTADATWVFRARLGGYTQNEAAEACRYFKECLTISPRSY